MAYSVRKNPIIAVVRLILASASPRRAELLRAAGFEFEIRPVDIDERLKPGELPQAYVERLAREKAEARTEADRDLPPHTMILGADTAVVVDGLLLSKPEDDEDAGRMLRRLSGRMHQVMTGVCLRTAKKAVSQVEVTNVVFDRLTEDEVAWYVASGEGRDKAGGYAIQGLASRFIPRIEGSYSNVVGLPIGVVNGLILQLIPARSLLASRE